MADTHDEFLQMIDIAVNDNNAEKQQQRLRAAMVNAWENRVQLFWEMAWEACQKKLLNN